MIKFFKLLPSVPILKLPLGRLAFCVFILIFYNIIGPFETLRCIVNENNDYSFVEYLALHGVYFISFIYGVLIIFSHGKYNVTLLALSPIFVLISPPAIGYLYIYFNYPGSYDDVEAKHLFINDITRLISKTIGYYVIWGLFEQSFKSRFSDQQKSAIT